MVLTRSKKEYAAAAENTSASGDPTHGRSESGPEDSHVLPSQGGAPSGTAHAESMKPSSTLPTGSRGSRTSTVVKAQVEAEYARRIAQLERAKLDKEAELAAARQAKIYEIERKVADAELRAQLAAIDSSSSQRSSSCASSQISSHKKVEKWLHENHSSGSKEPLCKALEGLTNVLSRNKQDKTMSNLKLPTYDGKSATEWLAFKRTFLDTQRFYSAGENLARLNVALRGTARDAVYVLLVSARDPEQVISALETRFGCPEKIVLQEINSVRTLPKVSNDGKDLGVFACRVQNCVEIIRLLNQSDYLRSPELFSGLIGKLTPLLRARWLDYAERCDAGISKLEMLAKFLTHEVQLQNKFGINFDMSSLGQSTSQPTHNRSQYNKPIVRCNTVSDRSDSSRKPISSNKNKSEINSCVFCKQLHDIVKCEKFLALSIDNRWTWVKANKVCYRCLQKRSHKYGFCKNKKSCGIEGCLYKHHVLLHNSKSELNVIAHAELDVEESGPSAAQSDSGEVEETRDASNEECIVETSAHATASTPGNCKPSRSLLKIIAVKVSGPSGSVNTFALLDDGCTATLIDAVLSKRIGAVGPKGRVHLDCMGGLSKVSQFTSVDFTIRGLRSADSYQVHNARSIEGLGIHCQRAVRIEDINKYPYLRDIADDLCYEDAQPMIVVGIDNCHLTVPKSIRARTPSEPMAIKTPLGWVVCGPISNSQTANREMLNHAIVSHDGTSGMVQNLDELIKEHYKLDSIGIAKHDYRGASDAHAIKILEETVQRLPDGRFETGLLWRPDIKYVPNNYKLALSRFLSLEKKMNGDIKYAELYRQNIHAMLDKRYAEECTKSPAGILWYLPHFGVTHPHKPGKLRIVHDAAAKFQGVSLNSLLLPGPDLLQPLLGILMRFREAPIALTADIREMFPQVKIREQDRDAQRFLWRDHPSEEIKTYCMSSMMFGTCSSPCTALYVKKVNAAEFQHEFPDAAHATVFDTYMDDYIGSQDTVEKAARLAADIVELNKRGGFEMRGWVSNNPSALSLLPKELVSDKCVSNFNDTVELGTSNNSLTVRTLGLIWQPHLDVISFSKGLENSKVPDRITKRDALSLVMRVYDPLGLLGPIVCRGRIMFQNVWRKNLSWDDELPQTEQKFWLDWLTDLETVVTLKIPRCYCLSEFDICERELHVFCDASELAYAAVAYWRIIYTNGDVKVALISSKSRVAPLKPTSIPRLELQGALIAARLASFISVNHKYKPIRRIFWCDSLNVLGWLQSDARSYKPFVAHRLGEILELTQVSEWRWIPSQDNVADDATRINRDTLTSTSRWLVGPEFLRSSEVSWPSPSPVGKACSPNIELKPSCRVNIITSQSFPSPQPLVVSPDRLSSWIRLVRATARAHKFIDLLRKRGTPKITSENLHLAEVHLLRHSQLEMFHEEILCLQFGQPLPRKSKLHSLSPVIDDEGIMRLRGRIGRTPDVDREMTQPIILDSRHRTVRLLIAHYHERAAHANTEMVVNELRQTYWVIHLRSAVRFMAHHCKQCRLRRTKPFDPPMGDLPDARLAHHKRPFTFSGLDYFGPMQITVGRRREKRYIGLFTCLVTRAVHLEIMHSLSTDSAIMGLRRFIARRGTPSEIWSDNGTAFVGTSRILKSLYGAEVETYVANERISWRFIPPSAPFMGGSWERLVRSVKTALKVTLKERAPTDEVLATLLSEAEALVNSRPLTHVSSDPDQEEALTPFHFLLGSSSGRSVPARVEDRDLLSRAGWKKALRLADHFWSRWIREYLPTLLPRRGHGPSSPPQLQIGDLVLIVDEQLPRGSWPRGRVTAVYPGRDGVTRVADILTTTGLFRRPLKKLVPIPTD